VRAYLRETFSLSVGYLAVGLAFGFWGGAFGLLSLAGWDNWLTRILCLSLGLITSHYVWRYSQALRSFPPMPPGRITRN
jgi:hypothetical protein